jgi:hypothetical protein
MGACRLKYVPFFTLNDLLALTRHMYCNHNDITPSTRACLAPRPRQSLVPWRHPSSPNTSFPTASLVREAAVVVVVVVATALCLASPQVPPWWPDVSNRATKMHPRQCKAELLHWPTPRVSVSAALVAMSDAPQALKWEPRELAAVAAVVCSGAYRTDHRWEAQGPFLSLLSLVFAVTKLLDGCNCGSVA